MYTIETRNRVTKEWDVREEGDAKSRRKFLHGRASKEAKSRHEQLSIERVQWRCVGTSL